MGLTKILTETQELKYGCQDVLEAAKWIWDWPSQLWVWPSPLEAAPPSLRVIEVRVDSMVDGHFDFSVSS